jgi:hypothetical protein
MHIHICGILNKKNQFPQPFSHMLSALTIFSLDFLALECLHFQGSDSYHVYYSTVLLWCAIPLLLAVAIVVVGITRYAKLSISSSSSGHREVTAENKAQELKKIYDQHMWLLLFLSYLVLPPVSNKQLQAFDCISLVSPGDIYLRSDTSINCQSKGYVQFVSLIACFVALYQLIPVIWMTLLYRRRLSLNPPTSNHDKQLSLFIRDHDPSLAYLKFLFVDYDCDKWWFEIADMYRRIIFIGIVPLISPNPATRASFGCILAIVSVAYFREEQPYRVEFTNVIAHVAQVCIL